MGGGGEVTYGGVGVGVKAKGVPPPGVVGVLSGRRTFERFFGPDSPIDNEAVTDISQIEGEEGGRCTIT